MVRVPARLEQHEHRFLRDLAKLQARNQRAEELHFRGLRAKYLVARALSAHLIVPVPPATSGIDFHHRGWAVKVKSVSTTVKEPKLWFRRQNGMPWDAAVLVLHHPANDDTVNIAGWAPRSLWLSASHQGEMYGKSMFVLEELALSPIHSLMRARARWESL